MKNKRHKAQALSPAGPTAKNRRDHEQGSTAQHGNKVPSLGKENVVPVESADDGSTVEELSTSVNSVSISEKSSGNHGYLHPHDDEAIESQPDQDMSPQDDLLQVTSTPDRGLAVFAARKIKAGTLVLAEHPLLCLSKDEENDSSAIERDFAKLSRPDQKRYLKLFDAEKSRMTRIASIYYSNCYNLDSFRHDGRGGSAVGAVASRINHSCIPNLQLSYNFETNMMMFYAIRDIPRGKEVCTNYEKNMFDIAVRRQRKLQMYYGFVCKCEACEGEKKNEFWAKSDERRKAMFEAFKLVQDCEKRFTTTADLPVLSGEQDLDVFDEALTALARLENLLLKEGLSGVVLANTYRSLSKWSERKRDIPRAIQWKDRERANCLHGLGPHAFRTVECEKKLQEFKQHALKEGEAK